MLIFNVLHIALSFASVGYNASSFTSNVTAFTQPYYPYILPLRPPALTPLIFVHIRITNILIARFLIDLQATNRAVVNINDPAGTSQASQQSSAVMASDADSLRFAGFIGSIGSVLTGDFGRADVEDADEEQEHPGPGETPQPAPAPGGSQRSIPGDEA
ncbi:hypothetical protein GSI_12506 [Ganoderma sinense ZZ0214-1]|uniref:Uncharacterized protein n=1 Tax=Ganoderma sinense ZZ0214-1 TaxID=1077348 RepID=A0A2G8RSY6_9APHY|nr:hypothetical protein GSI_12506 [Ganoderma sinense ZZ0214-1]